MSDLGYWLVMAGLAVVVVLATGAVTAYAYFSEDRWGKPRELVSDASDKVADAVSGGGSDDRQASHGGERHDVAA